MIKRLKQSGLYEFFEDIFDSQSIGFQKPSKEFFDYVMSHIKDFNIKEALVIGDSLNTDIKGGLLSGNDTYWMNGKVTNMLCRNSKHIYSHKLGGNI
jgi:2-haloacid dehalogenase